MTDSSEYQGNSRDKRPDGQRREHPRGNRTSRGGYSDRHNRGTRPQNKAYTHNAHDIRRSNRADRDRSPEIDEDVTGEELDRPVQRELETLSDVNRSWVAKHLVMAGRYVEDDPELAFEHALAASRRGGRVGFVREAVGITAYAAGDYAEALREFRTYRRITGDNSHLPEMIDCERALGRPEKALASVAEADLSKLTKAGRAEVAMVVSGIHQDAGRTEEAVKALEIPELDKSKAFPYSPRLFQAYADALHKADRVDEAKRWAVLSQRANKALGFTDEDEPAIVDLDGGTATTAPPPGGPRGARDRTPGNPRTGRGEFQQKQGPRRRDGR